MAEGLDEAVTIPWRWIVGALVAGVLIGWAIRTPTVRVEERIVTKTVTQWRTIEKIKTLPGATVYLTPDGGTMITGPVEIGRASEGSTSAMTDAMRKESKCPEWPTWALGGGPGLRLDGSRFWAGTIVRRAGSAFYGPLTVMSPPWGVYVSGMVYF